ncbi:MAG: hypothetical protein ACK4FL_04160 [Microgenomates group bacterium]
MVFQLNLEEKKSYRSIIRSGSFPPTTDKNFIFARLIAHIEEAFSVARKVNYLVGEMTIFLKKNNFLFQDKKIKLIPKTNYPFLIHPLIKETFERIYKEKVKYRACGCVVGDFEEEGFEQGFLFDNLKKKEKIKKLYWAMEKTKIDFGTVLYEKKGKKEIIKDKKLRIPFIEVFST